MTEITFMTHDPSDNFDPPSPVPAAPVLDYCRLRPDADPGLHNGFEVSGTARVALFCAVGWPVAAMIGCAGAGPLLLALPWVALAGVACNIAALVELRGKCSDYGLVQYGLALNGLWLLITLGAYLFIITHPY